MLTISFSGGNILVVGGSKGIGAAVAAMASEAGAKVALTHRRPGSEAGGVDAADAMTIRDEGGAEVVTFAVDCADEDGTRKMVDALADRWGSVGHLVYCAGFTSPVPFMSLDSREWRRVVDINLTGAFVACQAVLRHMREGGGGSIVLVGSAAVATGGGGRADYVSAKAGLEGLSRAVAKEFAGDGVRCNIVHPSLIDTDLLRGRYPDEAERSRVAMATPLQRLGRPDDVAHAILFLLSDWAAYITGQSLYVDGGRGLGAAQKK